MAEMSYLTCSNKGCYKTGYYRLDTDSNEVICDDCGGSVDVSPYMKKILIQNKQVFTKAKTSESQKKICDSCGKEAVPLVLCFPGDKMQVVCPRCGKENSHLTKFFTNPLMMNPDVEKLNVQKVSGQVVATNGSPLPWVTDVVDTVVVDAE